MSPSPRSSRRCWPPDSVRTRLAAFSREPDDVDDLVDRARRGVEAGVHLEHLARGEIRVEAARLQHDADARPELRAAVGRIEAEHADVAAVALAVPLEDLDRRRLARAVRSEDRQHFALGDAEAEVANGGDTAVRLAQTPDLDRAHGAMSTSRSVRTSEPRAKPREPCRGRRQRRSACRSSVRCERLCRTAAVGQAPTDAVDAVDVVHDALARHLGFGVETLDRLDAPVPQHDRHEHLIVVQHEVVDARRRDRGRVRG